MSSKNAITLGDLNTALKPLIEAINGLREDQCTCNTQVSELYGMITNLSTKMDLFDQRNNAVSPKVVVKKVPAKKGAIATSTPVAKKAPAKKGAAVAKATTDADADADDATEDADTDASTNKEEKKAPVKKAPVKKAPAKKTTVEEPDDTEEATDTEEKKTPAKKPTNMVGKKPASKAPGKKTAVKPEAVKRALNKMEFFNKMFDTDETFFDAYITNKDKKAMEEENKEAWADADGDALKKLKRTAYYHFMKDNKDDKLQAMKNAYIEETTTKKVEVVEKEDATDD